MPQPFCRAEFATLGENSQPTFARVTRAEGKHEMLTLRFRDRNLSSRNYRSGLPIYVTWGILPRYREEFFGYIHFAEPRVERGETGAPEIEALAVGTTRVLRHEEPRAWGHTRTDLVATDLAREHRLGVDVDRAPLVHDSLLQDAQSGWAFLRELAEEEGLHLSVHGPRINLWDLKKRMPTLQKYAPIFRRDRNEVSKFTPSMNETGRKRDATRNIAYAVDREGRESAFSDQFIPLTDSLEERWSPQRQYRKVHSGVFDTAAQAQEYLSVQREKSRRVYEAKATVAPFPRLRPGDPLVFEGYGRRQSGFWIVDEAEFELTPEKITAGVTVSRALVEDDGRRPSTPGGKSPYRKPSRAQLVRRRWVERQ